MLQNSLKASFPCVAKVGKTSLLSGGLGAVGADLNNPELAGLTETTAKGLSLAQQVSPPVPARLRDKMVSLRSARSMRSLNQGTYHAPPKAADLWRIVREPNTVSGGWDFSFSVPCLARKMGEFHLLKIPLPPQEHPAYP